MLTFDKLAKQSCMQKFLFLFLVLLGLEPFGSKAQQFQRVYGGQSYDVGKSLLQAQDNGFYIAGSTGSFGLESAQVMLIKTTDFGHTEWRKYYGSEFADQASSMVFTTDNNIIIAGFTEKVGKSYDAYAIKVSLIGDTIWSRNFGGELWEFTREVVALADGGYALFGQTYSYGAGNGDFHLLRLDANGDTLWTRTYGGPELESGESIAVTADGGFILAGYTESYGQGGIDGYLVRTDSDGDTLWTKTYGDVDDEHIYSVIETSDGGIAIAGSTRSSGAGETDFLIKKLSALGVEDWTVVDGGELDDVLYDIVEDGVGNLVVVGYTAAGTGGGEDFRIIRWGADGVWNNLGRSFGSAKDDRAHEVIITPDNGYAVIGKSNGFLEQFDDAYLVKMDHQGQSGDLALAVNEIQLEDKQFKVSVGPNPFSESPTFYIQGYNKLVSELNAQIELKVFNSIGEQVHYQRLGSSNTALTEMDLSAGIYYFQLMSGSTFLASGKMVCLK